MLMPPESELSPLSSLPSAPSSPWLAVDSDPACWLGPTPMLNTGDTRLRLRVQSVVQLHASVSDQVRAIHTFVRAIPFGLGRRYGARTARDVLDRKEGAWHEKTTLFLAMLRAAGVPARLRVLSLPGDVLRGLVQTAQPFFLPLAEVWLDGRWMRTDTHIYDLPLLALARRELKSAGWVRGYGLNHHGATHWKLDGDAFAALAPDHSGGMPIGDLGVYHDVSAFLAGTREREPGTWALRLTQYRLLRPRLREGVARLTTQLARHRSMTPSMY